MTVLQSTEETKFTNNILSEQGHHSSTYRRAQPHQTLTQPHCKAAAVGTDRQTDSRVLSMRDTLLSHSAVLLTTLLSHQLPHQTQHDPTAPLTTDESAAAHSASCVLLPPSASHYRALHLYHAAVCLSSVLSLLPVQLARCPCQQQSGQI